MNKTMQMLMNYISDAVDSYYVELRYFEFIVISTTQIIFFAVRTENSAVHLIK